MPTAADLQAQNEQLSSAHSEAKAALEKTVANYCPFGCQGADLDDFGYCHHLVGFTNDRKTCEPQEKLYRAFKDGTPYDTGWKTVGGSIAIEPGDVFVNPERVQKETNGHAHLTKLWVSDRVYRQRDKAAVQPAPQAQPNALFELQAKKRELEKRMEEKKLREDIARMQAELGDEVDTTVACELCGKECKNAHGLNLHMQSKHPTN